MTTYDDTTREMEAELEALSEMWWDELFARTPEAFWDKVEADIKAEQERGELIPLDEWLESEDCDNG